MESEVEVTVKLLQSSQSQTPGSSAIYTFMVLSLKL
jgi:hypothetical protein